MEKTVLTPNERKLRRNSLLHKVFGQCAIWLVLIVMYIPIGVLIVYSFSANDVIGGEVFNFSFVQYSKLFTDAEIMIEALRHGLSVGEVSTVFYKNERRGTFVPFRAIFEFLRNLIYYRFFKKS